MAYRIIHFALSRNYSDGNKRWQLLTTFTPSLLDLTMTTYNLFSSYSHKKSVPFGFLRLIFSCGGFFSHVYYEKKDSRHPPTTFLFCIYKIKKIKKSLSRDLNQ